MVLSNNGKVSILMNCRDGEAYVKQAIDSVYAQTYQNFEIIFVDNHSKDASAKFANAYDEKVRYLLTPEPMSLFSARNYGLAQCTGEYFCILDADDYWEKAKLEVQIKYLGENPSALFIYSNAKLLYQGKKIKTVMVNILQKIKKVFVFQGPRNIKSLVKNYDINFQTIMVKTSYAKQTKFNARLHCVGDFDFNLRVISDFNLTPFYLSKSLSTTRLHAMQVSAQAPAKWLREVKYVLINTILKRHGKEIARLFHKELARKRFVYFLGKKQPFIAIKKISVHLPTDPYLFLIVSFKLTANLFRKNK